MLRIPFVFALTSAVVTAALDVSGQNPAPTAARRIVVIGCITRAASTQAGDKNPGLIITDYRGGPSPIVQLDPNDGKVTPWVNYTVELAGTLAPGSGGTGSTAAPRMNVAKVSVISRGCKSQTPSKSAG